MKVLIQGWINIPHSYAIVNCFQLIHLQKNFGKELEIYVQEREYFKSNWVKKLVYPEEYNQQIRDLRVWRGEPVDIIYSITYPYNISKIDVPKCVFYTSEFAVLDKSYFIDEKNTFDNIDVVETYLDDKNLFFTSPSEWSKLGLSKLNVPDSHNRVITHGVDTSIFHLNKSKNIRRAIRNKYNVSDTDILLVNIGSMTGNKGMVQTFIVLNHLIKMGKSNFKLLLKGTEDLYESQLFIENYFNILRENNMFTGEDENNLKRNIIYLNSTLSYSRINDLFNAADLYISPYLAEGFNLTVLEAISSGLPVLVPETGSTKEYINDIESKFGDYILKLKSDVFTDTSGKSQNKYDLNELYNLLITKESHINRMKNDRYINYDNLHEYIEDNYSWNSVSKLLYSYFKEILDNGKLII